VHTAAAEVGQGIVTVQLQIARTELGLERVVVLNADTQIGSAGSSSASRQTWMTGAAVKAACDLVNAELDGRARDRGISRDRLADLLDTPVDHRITYRHKPTEPLNAGTQNHGHVAFLFAAHRASVDVDLGTGLVKVVQVATAQDVGKAINPVAVIGQLEGGIAQGLGLAIRAGVHTGEVQTVAGDVRGIAVHTAARIMAVAASDEILVSATVMDLLDGSGLTFEDAGAHELKGLHGPRQLYRLATLQRN